MVRAELSAAWTANLQKKVVVRIDAAVHGDLAKEQCQQESSSPKVLREQCPSTA